MATVPITVGAVGDAPTSANISALGRDRTIIYVGGSAADSVAFDVSADNTNWAPLPFKVYGAAPAPIELSDSAQYIRARRLAGTGAAACAVSAASTDAPPLTVHERYAAAAGTDSGDIAFYEERAPGGRTVTEVRLVPSQAIATNATDKITVTVFKVVAGTPTTIATYQSQTTAMVAATGIGLTLANVALPQGAVVGAGVTHGGAGKIYDFQVQVTVT
jgi:hypothetical protein